MGSFTLEKEMEPIGCCGLRPEHALTHVAKVFDRDLGRLEGEITADPSDGAGSLPSAGNSRELVSRARADPPGRDAW